MIQSQKNDNNWHIVRFGNVAKKISNIVDRRNCNLDHFVAGEHMQTDDFRIKEWGTIDDGYLGPAFNHKFNKGQILYGSRRTYLRKVSIPHFDGVCANTTFVIEPTGNDLIPELLPFVMQSARFIDHSIRMSKGSTNPYINWKDIAFYEFAVPEKEQQRRIATTLWAVEDCIVKGERFLAVVERTKQVLMRELFSKGIGHQDYKENENIGQIPEKWNTGQLSTFFEILSGQYFKYTDFCDNGIKCLKIDNVGYGEINWNNTTFLPEKFIEEFPSLLLTLGDIIIALNRPVTNNQLKIGMITSKDIPSILYQRVGKFVFKNDGLDKQFIFYYFHSGFFKKNLLQLLIGTDQPYIRTPELLKILIPLPPLPEQRQIATILTRCNETIAAARANVVAAKALKMKMINEMLSPEVE